MRFSSNRISFVGYLLGLGGLVPFIGLAALSFTVSPAQRPAVIFSLLAYSATIISFLGAIHWGLTMVENLPSTQQLVWGVVPSLLAWISLMVQGEWGLLLVAAVLLLCLAVDYRTYPHFGLHHWSGLRLTLSMVAIVSVVLPALHGLGLFA
jgi:predicted ferric reductase